MNNTEYIIERVTRFYEISKPMLMLKSRLREISEPRQVAMYIMSKRGLKNRDISAYFDLDHATVNYAVKSVSNLLNVDKAFRSKIELLIASAVVGNTCYIAGKVRGIDQHVASIKFENAEQELRVAGFATVNPLKLELPQNDEPTVWRILLNAMTKCDSICFMWDCYDSDGSRFEMMVADKLGLNKYYMTNEYQITQA